eukprot:3571397-Amphidinium_carterae.1
MKLKRSNKTTQEAITGARNTNQWSLGLLGRQTLQGRRSEQRNSTQTACSNRPSNVLQNVRLFSLKAKTVLLWHVVSQPQS